MAVPPTRTRDPHPDAIDVAVTLAALVVVLFGERPLVDAVVVGGLGVVAPLALGPSRRWTVAAACAAPALVLSPGALAVVLVLPAVLAAGVAVVTALAAVTGPSDRPGPDRRAPSLADPIDAAAAVLAPVWALVATVSLLASAAGRELFDIGEPIVRLTAVHYLYAGTGALAIARRLRAAHTGPPRTAAVAVVATALAPPVVAAGFVLGEPVPQIGGAVLMTLGVWATAIVLLATARRTAGPAGRLRLVAGLVPWIPMVLAVAWATAQHVVGFPALSVPDMGRLHGLANGVGFVLLGLIATRVAPTTDGLAR